MGPFHRKVVFRSRNGAPNLKRSRISPLLKRTMATLIPSIFSIPLHFTQPSSIRDELTTQTSIAQQDTVAECLPFLNSAEDASKSPFDFNEHGVPRLDRQGHIDFLHESLREFPAGFVAVDASRPWMVYWALMGLYLLGEDVTCYRDRSVMEFYLTSLESSRSLLRLSSC